MVAGSVVADAAEVAPETFRFFAVLVALVLGRVGEGTGQLGVAVAVQVGEEIGERVKMDDGRIMNARIDVNGASVMLMDPF